MRSCALLIAGSLLSAAAWSADRAEGLDAETQTLGEQVTRSKAALELLQALVGVESHGPRLRVVVENRLGPAYAVDDLRVTLDGSLLCAPDVAGWEPGATLPCHEAPAASGAYTLGVRAALSGTGVGIFPYMEDATFELVAASDVQLGASANGQLRVLLRARSALTHSFWDRPEVVVAHDGAAPP